MSQFVENKELKKKIKVLTKKLVKVGAKYDSKFAIDYWSESLRRLKNLERIIGILEKKIWNLRYRRETTDENCTTNKSQVLLYDIFMYSEAFYYFAFRLIKVLNQLPDFEKLEVKEITIVRNKLIEHPDNKDSLLLSSELNLGTELDGPIIKPTISGKFKDKGLYYNARILTSEIEKLISNT